MLLASRKRFSHLNMEKKTSLQLFVPTKQTHIPNQHSKQSVFFVDLKVLRASRPQPKRKKSKTATPSPKPQCLCCALATRNDGASMAHAAPQLTDTIEANSLNLKKKTQVAICFVFYVT